MNIFPARAGLNLDAETLLACLYNIPRTGGVEPVADITKSAVAQYSPHGRG